MLPWEPGTDTHISISEVLVRGVGGQETEVVVQSRAQGQFQSELSVASPGDTPNRGQPPDEGIVTESLYSLEEGKTDHHKETEARARGFLSTRALLTCIKISWAENTS